MWGNSYKFRSYLKCSNAVYLCRKFPTQSIRVQENFQQNWGLTLKVTYTLHQIFVSFLVWNVFAFKVALVGGAYGGRWSTPTILSIPELHSMEAWLIWNFPSNQFPLNEPMILELCRVSSPCKEYQITWSHHDWITWSTSPFLVAGNIHPLFQGTTDHWGPLIVYHVTPLSCWRQMWLHSMCPC